MAKGRKESPSVTPTPPQPAPPTLAATTVITAGVTKTVKKKKSVSWAPDGRLEQIKLIERAVYDDDPVDVSIFLFASPLDSWCEISVYLLGALLCYRERRFTTSVISIETRVQPCMPKYSRSSLIGWSLKVREPQITCHDFRINTEAR